MNEKNDRDREAEPTKVKVTDKRRVRPDGEAHPGDPAAGSPPEPESSGPTGEVAPESATELQKAQEEAAGYLDHLRRLQAEFENYRKRVLKEQTRAVEMASEPLLRRLLEVLDEFELALMAAEKKPDFDKFLHGVELVYAKLMDSLKAEGLEKIDAQGKHFDPERHEALMGSAGGDGDLLVADVLRQGYSLRGRVIRPAGVRVSPSTHETS